MCSFGYESKSIVSFVILYKFKYYRLLATRNDNELTDMFSTIAPKLLDTTNLSTTIKKDV